MSKYYLHDGQQRGPFTLEELAAKNLRPETPVWTEGMADWKPAGTVEELASLFAGAPPPFAADAKHKPLFGPETMEAAIKYMEETKQKLRRWYGTIGGVAAGVLLLLILWNGRQTTLLLSSIKETKEQKQEFRNHWENVLRVEAVPGGNRDNANYEPHIDFKNDGNYLVNQMTALVVFRGGATKPVTVYNVAPHQTVSYQLGYNSKDPESVSIVEVISGDAELLMKPNYDSGEPGDPYHMK